MKVKSTAVKKPIIRLGNGKVVMGSRVIDGKIHRTNKPKRDLSKPIYAKKIQGSWQIFSSEPMNKPFFTFHSQDQLKDFIKINSEKSTPKARTVENSKK